MGNLVTTVPDYEQFFNTLRIETYKFQEELIYTRSAAAFAREQLLKTADALRKGGYY